MMQLAHESGLEYCVVHHGIVECDEGGQPCDFARDPHLPAEMLDEDGELLVPCQTKPLVYFR
jgi:hypothetical protein